MSNEKRDVANATNDAKHLSGTSRLSFDVCLHVDTVNVNSLQL